MLTPEQAAGALEKVRNDDWRDQLLAAVANLPKALREPARAILGHDARGKEIQDWAARNRSRWTGAKHLDEMDVKDRPKLFAAFFPELAAQVEAGWQLHQRLPYQRQYDRKAFRAPHTPALTRQARGDWLDSLLMKVGGYRQDITWFAAWAPHLGGGGGADALGILLAATIDTGGPEGEAVFNILCQSARGEHEIGAMGWHVTRALLVASRPDGWEFIESLLLAPQCPEGLRQTILESMDEAHPEAFRRMLRLIVEHDLARFGATVQAMDVWFGYQWGAVSARIVNKVLEQVSQFLNNPEARAKGLESDDSETVYQALWAIAFEDAEAAVAPAAKLLADPNVERRFVAVHLLGQLGLPQARAHLLSALEDQDLRVALRALEDCRGDSDSDTEPDHEETDLFERIERLLARMPTTKTHLEPIVWPWHVLTADRETVASDLISYLGKRSPARLTPYLPIMAGSARAHVVNELAKMKKWDESTRDALFALVGDADKTVRTAGLQALAKSKVVEAEAVRLEQFLTSKAGDLRRGVLTLLLNQKDEAVLASADRLLAASSQLQRLAGLELLRQMVEAKRVPEACRARAESYRTSKTRLPNEETKHLDVILDTGRQRS
jgi:hypothetical protein